MGVYFVSREPVRAPAPLRDFAAISRALSDRPTLKKVAGTLSVPSLSRWVIAACPRGLGTAAESGLVEVYEYDAVRYQALVVGLVEPPADTPVHWIYRRVNPAAHVVAVCPQFEDLAPAVPRAPAPKGYLGNTDTLIALGRRLKAKEACFVEGIGLVAGAKDPEALVEVLAAAAGPPPPGEDPA
jgi:hypothetical protein